MGPWWLASRYRDGQLALKRVTVNFPSDLHLRLKLRSVETDRFMNDLVVEAVEMYLQKNADDNSINT